MQKGVAAVEFALILPLLLVLLFGIVEFSLMLYNKAVITNASRDAARSATAFRTPKLTAAEIDKIVVDSTTHLISFSANTPNVTFNPALDPVNPPLPGTPISITVEYDYSFLVFGGLLSLLSGGSIANPITLSATTVMNHE